MNKLSASFESVWKENLEPKARALGAHDADLDRARTAAKNMMIAAGWATVDGKCEFISENDLKNCLETTTPVVEKATQTAMADRRVVTAQTGFVPTKAQVVAGAAKALVSAGAEPVELTSAQVTTASNSLAGLAAVGDRCPRCSGSMDPVGLVNDRAGLYCPRDRVVLPLPANQTVRD